MASFNYTTVEGDRIDLLAAKFYGSMDGIAIISDANPLVPLTAGFFLGPGVGVRMVVAATLSFPLRRFFRWARCW